MITAGDTNYMLLFVFVDSNIYGSRKLINILKVHISKLLHCWISFSEVKFRYKKLMKIPKVNLPGLHCRISFLDVKFKYRKLMKIPKVNFKTVI